MTDVLDLIAYKDGRYLSLQDAGPSILDFGFIHSDATYDVMSIRNGKLFLADEHLARFKQSTEFYNFKVPNSEEIKTIALEVADRNNIQNGFVWMIAWRGSPESRNPRDIEGCPHHFVVYVKEYYNFNSDNKASVVLYKDHYRVPDTSFGQQYKNFCWIDLTLAQRYAISKKADTAIMISQDGYITEGPGFAVGFVFGEEVCSPQKDILQSVTVDYLSSLTPIVKRNITWEESLTCNEMFLASTSGGIIPVIEYEGRTLETKFVEALQDEYKL